MKILLTVMCLSFVFSCKKKTNTITVSVEAISESVYASGFIKSKNQYQVYSTVGGIIKQMLVTEGDSVRVGTPLMRIFNKSTQLATANAQLTADYESLSTNMGKFDEAILNIELAENKAKNDSLLWQRTKNLWAQNIGTQVDSEQKQLNYKNSLTSYQTAVIHYNDLKRKQTLSARQSQNTLKINKIAADEYVLKSELVGKVYSLLKKEGELVNSQNYVAIIGDQKEFLIELQVDEYDITKIKLKQKALISMDSHKGSVFEAYITKVDPIMNERTKSFTIEAVFIKSPSVLYPFLTTEANIVIQTKVNALTLPRTYLLNDSTVLLEDKKERKITTGLKDYKKIEILSGLTSKDVILNPIN